MIETRNEDGWFHADYADLKIIDKGRTGWWRLSGFLLSRMTNLYELDIEKLKLYRLKYISAVMIKTQEW